MSFEHRQIIFTDFNPDFVILPKLCRLLLLDHSTFNMDTDSYLGKVYFELVGQHLLFLFSVDPFLQRKNAGNPSCVET